MIIFDNVTKQHNPRIQVVHKFMITGFPLGQGNQGKSRNMLEGQGTSGKLEIFLEKVREENFYPCSFLTSVKKSFACRYVWSWIVFDNQFYIWCYYLHLVLRWFNIVNPFILMYVFHFEEEGRLHAINCVVFCFCLLFCPLVWASLVLAWDMLVNFRGKLWK